MLLGWVGASRTGLEALREGPQPTMFFELLFFPILDDFGSKMGWVWAPRTGLMAFREGPQPTMFFGSLFFPILDDFGSKMGVQKPSFLANFEGQKS